MRRFYVTPIKLYFSKKNKIIVEAIIKNQEVIWKL
jgi:hypothetical protein